MPQLTSGHCSIRFSHLEDCGTFGVPVLSVASKAKKAMWSTCLCTVSLHCSPTGPGPNSRLGQGFESRHCPVRQTVGELGRIHRVYSCWRICLLARTQTIAAKQDVVINSHGEVHQDVCKTLENKSRVHLSQHEMLG